MTRNHFLIAIVALLPLCAWGAAPAQAPQAGKPSDERAMVIATIDRYVAAIAAKCAADTPVQAPPVEKPSGEEALVLAAMDRYVAAISAKDIQTMAAMQTPEGMTYRAQEGEGNVWQVIARPNAAWVDRSRLDVHTHRERYWSPTVLIRGAIAVVWAPYEYWVDGKTSHCGMDEFDFVKVADGWRVSNSMWTIEPNSCPKLRPADPSMLRPAG